MEENNVLNSVTSTVPTPEGKVVPIVKKVVTTSNKVVVPISTDSSAIEVFDSEEKDDKTTKEVIGDKKETSSLFLSGEVEKLEVLDEFEVDSLEDGKNEGAVTQVQVTPQLTGIDGNKPVTVEVSSPNLKTEVSEVVNIDKKPVKSSSPSIIDMYGEVLTNKEYVTNPAIARDQEINKMILALITPDKSALLVGKPGIGKTALVEGLAYRIHTNQVPNAIAGWTVIKINLPALLGKIVVDGVEVSKLQLLINEIDCLEKTILFIDEVHLLVAHNNGAVDLDFANMLKPYLDRGRIKMIGATTSEEYEEYVLRDRAFVRRFIKIDIAEAQGADVVKIIEGTYPKFVKQMGIDIAYSEFQRERIFTWIVEHTSEYKRVYEIQNRYPDICLTIVSSAFSYALFENADKVTLKHFYLAMKNTGTIYEDSKVKAIEDFKERFKDMLIKEGIDPNLI